MQTQVLLPLTTEIRHNFVCVKKLISNSKLRASLITKLQFYRSNKGYKTHFPHQFDNTTKMKVSIVPENLCHGPCINVDLHNDNVKTFNLCE